MSPKYNHAYSVHGVTDRQTDGQTAGQTDGQNHDSNNVHLTTRAKILKRKSTSMLVS